MNHLWRRTFAEGMATFWLVFAGTGAITIDALHEGVASHVGVGLVFGLVVMVMIYSIGELSGAHLNPAITLGFFLAGRFPLREVWFYVAAQCIGAVAASGVLRLILPDAPTLGQTAPSGSWSQAFILEIFLTAMLAFVILCVATGSKEQGIMAGIAIGGAVGLEAIFAGPISGASMNPARSLGPAVVAGDMSSLWVYLVAPVIGAALAVAMWRAVVANPRD